MKIKNNKFKNYKFPFTFFSIKKSKYVNSISSVVKEIILPDFLFLFFTFSLIEK
jgi:hypothetical protein